MVEIQEIRRQILTALEALEMRKSALAMEGLDLENRGDDVITGLTNIMISWVALAFISACLQSKFLGGSMSLVFIALLMIVVGWGNAFVMARRRIRWMAALMDDFKRKKTILNEDVKQLVIELHRTQKACQSKVTPVLEDFPAFNDGVGYIFHNTDWLSRQEFFEKRFEYLRSWHDCDDFEGHRMLFIKGIAICGILLLFCFLMALYYFYGR
ncbi:hypothetical protein ACH5RR_022787 [Cinchona calisaya]|uniref:SMODS and SLOG-associating 2TM effector domain-containing protein n=1 Tax=Cinchona calisaya TaxID=153742 RepID=A0ABD2Z8U5_9GENT